MKAFHNDPKIKTKYVNRVKAHAKADEIVKGKYWENGKGCAVGCTIHSSNHSAFETELGIPTWIARLEDTIFEGLPNARAMTWPLELLKSTRVGVDLNQVKIPMLIFICETSLDLTEDKVATAYINGVLNELRKPIIDNQTLLVARNQPRPTYATAATAAADAAYAATYAATATAADAAYAATYAADAAYAANAARGNTYIKFANKLLELIKACK